MKIPRHTLLALALASLLPLSARAGCRLTDCGFIVAANSALPVIGMHDMVGGRWVLEVAPAFWTMKTGTGGQAVDVHPKGFAGSLALQREFSPRWGLGIVAATSRQSGEVTTGQSLVNAIQAASDANAGTVGGAGSAGGTIKNMGGSYVALLATHDFFSDPEGFRLPVSFGVAMVQNRLDYSHEFTNPADGSLQRETMKIDHSGLGAVVNVSADFLVKEKLRVMPGFYLAHGLAYLPAVEYKVQKNNGAVQTFSRDQTSTQAAPSLYLSFLWRPWNLGFTWNYTEVALGGNVTSNSIYSLHWAKRWGGA